MYYIEVRMTKPAYEVYSDVAQPVAITDKELDAEHYTAAPTRWSNTPHFPASVKRIPTWARFLGPAYRRLSPAEAKAFLTTAKPPSHVIRRQR